MIDHFSLKGGLEAKLPIWRYPDIESYVEQEHPTYELNNMGDKAFSGWAYFGPSLAYDLEHTDMRNDYDTSDAQELSPLEIQTPGGQGKKNYHRAIVATLGGEPIGITVCEWTKFSSDYWNYHLRYIDVDETYKNQGVGTNMIRALDEADFLKGKILKTSMFSQEGHRFIRHVMQRELKAEDYAVIYDDYYGGRPTAFGTYPSSH
jgi:hypothetical protein